MLSFLPGRFQNAIRFVNIRNLYELRLRADKPSRINYDGKFCYFGERGIVTEREEAIVPTKQEIGDILFAASGYSVYAVENQLRRGFVTGSEGERIGIAGTYVYEGTSALSVRDVTSLCIRVPHAVEGCAEELYQKCFQNGICSLLVLSPPGEGKTTLLRDLARLVSQRTLLNVLVSDERGELSAGELGDTCDVIRFADKETAFTAGIRAMRPDVIVTDELMREDYVAVQRAMESGIAVMASAHLTRVDDVPEKIFKRYAVLNGIGKISGIYGADNVD